MASAGRMVIDVDARALCASLKAHTGSLARMAAESRARLARLARVDRIVWGSKPKASLYELQTRLEVLEETCRGSAVLRERFLKLSQLLAKQTDILRARLSRTLGSGHGLTSTDERGTRRSNAGACGGRRASPSAKSVAKARRGGKGAA